MTALGWSGGVVRGSMCCFMHIEPAVRALLQNHPGLGIVPNCYLGNSGCAGWVPAVEDGVPLESVPVLSVSGFSMSPGDNRAVYPPEGWVEKGPGWLCHHGWGPDITFSCKCNPSHVSYGWINLEMGPQHATAVCNFPPTPSRALKPCSTTSALLRHSGQFVILSLCELDTGGVLWPFSSFQGRASFQGHH